MKCGKKQCLIISVAFGFLFCAGFLYRLKSRQVAPSRGLSSTVTEKSLKGNTKNREFASLYTNEVESRSGQMMEKARKLHHAEDYSSANKILTKILTKYPYAGLREEASFLLARGLFYEGEYLLSEQVIQSLRDDDIHSKWLGRSLLILAKIHQQKGDTDESFRLYDHVIKEFSEYPEVISEARNSLPTADF